MIAGQVRRLRRLLPPAPARILDAGCGPGLYAVPLAAVGHDVTGIDVSAPALRHARGLARGARLLGRARFDGRSGLRRNSITLGCVVLENALPAFVDRPVVVQILLIELVFKPAIDIGHTGGFSS